MNRMLRLYSNGKTTGVAEALRSALRRYEKATCAVAYITAGGIEAIKTDLRRFLRRGGQLEMFTTGKGFITTPDALRRLQAIGVKTIRFRPPTHSRLFHGKVFLFESVGKLPRLIVGSANLTQGGLVENEEIGLDCELPSNSHVLRRIEKLFARYRPKGSGFPLLTPRLLDKYAAAWKEGRPKPGKLTPQTRRRLEDEVSRTEAEESESAVPNTGDSRYRINAWWPLERKRGRRKETGGKLFFQRRFLDRAKQLRPGDRVFLYETKARPNKEHLPGVGKVFGMVEVTGRLKRRENAQMIEAGRRKLRFDYVVATKQHYFVEPKKGIPYKEARECLGRGNFRFAGGLSAPLDLTRAQDLERKLASISGS